MSDPSNLPADSTDPGLDPSPSRKARPVGESGGHTVQDWEQPPPGRRPTLSDAVQADGDAMLMDDPSPAVTPLYLRAEPKGAHAVQPEFDARTHTLTAQTAALVDALTRGFADALADAMRPIVASSVDQLLPMLQTLGSVPDDDVETEPSESSPGPAAAT